MKNKKQILISFRKHLYTFYLSFRKHLYTFYLIFLFLREEEAEEDEEEGVSEGI